MACEYCLHQRSEKQYRNQKVNHDGSLEYITGKDLYTLLISLLEKMGTKSAAGGEPQPAAPMFLTPYERSNGSTDWIDLYSNRVIAITGVESRKPYYLGPKNFISTLGGRGEFSEIVKMYADGDYFHDKRK